MTDQLKSTFARRIRAARPRARKDDIRDDIVTGLGLTIQPSGVRTFFFACMVRGRRRFSTIGSADVLTVPEARREARRLIANYIELTKMGNGPRTPGHPMIAFAEEFLERHARHWKPRTVDTNRRVVHKNILPAFGHMTVDAITDNDVKRWFASLSERPGIANRAMPVLLVMMPMADLWGYRAHNTNPCKRTRRYRMEPKERFLTAEEMVRLNAVLTRDEFWCPHIIAIGRLLMLTGCRRAKGSICDGATSGTTPSPCRTARLVRAARRSAGPRETSSRCCPDPAIQTRSCFRASLGANTHTHTG